MSVETTYCPGQFAYPFPYGATIRDGGVQFSVFSRSALEMRLLLYNNVDDREPDSVISFDREVDRWGDIWSLFVPGTSAGQLYHFQAGGPYEPRIGHRFDGKARLIDPYATALAGEFQPAPDGIIRPPKCVVVDGTFDWENDRHPRKPLAETVIYEMHVRGFTEHPSSKVQNPGTYLGVIERIPYLKSLGVTAVELMPVYEFPTTNWQGEKTKNSNYWGYDPMCFFAPHRGYAASKEPGAQVREFKEMVRALHNAGIEVILDVVFNHTSEGNELGPTFSFKGLENRVYYMLDAEGNYKNYTGCGNTVNGNHPVVREMIFHCLRHWVHNFHIDGFRFDLASILSRDRRGEIVANTPVVELIAEDPLLADSKVIAEAWDAAGAYQVGSFANLRWAEWNGRYRDDSRRFWRGDDFMLGALATRLAGSSDLYQAGGRSPYHSINFVTSHDGFTLNDLVSYSEKHNEANGEQNRDGDNHNCSHNHGVEGPTDREDIERVRRRQVRNMLATLLLSQGVPMILYGDECRRTQRGNNNAYCQDNDISWFDWSLVEKNADLVRFVQALLKFRAHQPALRRTHFLNGRPEQAGMLSDVSWFNAQGGPVNWSANERTLICLLAPTPAEENSATTPWSRRHVLLLLHAGFSPKEFQIPRVARDLRWRTFLDTAAAPPLDIYPQYDGPLLPKDGKLTLTERSLVVLVSV
jgi:isoamylase